MKCFFCSLILLKVALCHPVPSVSPIASTLPTSETFDFMKRYGYLDDTPNSEALYTEDAIRDVIKTMQKFGGIPQTGVVDNATLALMKARRCGVPDIIRNSRSKRYVLGSKGWKKRHITYYLYNWTPKLGEEVIAQNIQQALDTWGKYGRLTFNRVYDFNADIIVMFARGPHGDNFAFDGPGEVLAHAFFPSDFHGRGGDIHFDEEEEWSIHTKESTQGTDFFTVAFHELGHSLGLSHSPVVSSIMFPYYQGYANDLDYDDILGMYALYIQGMPESGPVHFPPPSPPRTTTARTPPAYDYDEDENSVEETDQVDTDKEDGSYNEDDNEIPNIPETEEPEQPETGYESNEDDKDEGLTDDVVKEEDLDEDEEHLPDEDVTPGAEPSIPDVCEGNIDAISAIREQLFVFKGEYFWRLRDKNQLEQGYPARIQQMFPLPESIRKIDAVYERPDSMIVLFSGSQFWVYDGHVFVEDSPQSLSKYGLPDDLDRIDAVISWPKNGKTYLFKNDRMWRYNEDTRTVDAGYPMHIQRWRGVPENLDAAMSWNDGKTYFFKGKLYWTFDDTWISVTETSPLPMPQLWLGCPEKQFVRDYFANHKPKNETDYHQLYGQP
uniref:Peptidase metallopeptidase domain-containing protein n=1 Tax=Photinus pyralis TaxID=7054 RepID=A0A1Y1L9K3_PHOPY